MNGGAKRKHRPCPACGSHDQVYLRYLRESRAIQAYCRKCNFTLTLDTAFPCPPDAILEEWDRRTAHDRAETLSVLRQSG